MSAAATAAGYLYASGRLRGRTGREQEEPQQQPKRAPSPQKEKIRVAVYPDPKEERPRRAPKIEYRRRRWTPE